MDDRIRLAEAMGGSIWEAYIDPGKHPECVDLPDPFINANDDYAVLEWMRKKTEFHKPTNARFSIHQYLPTAWNYKIGDYARAALKVLE